MSCTRPGFTSFGGKELHEISPLVWAEGITKSFPGVIALRSVSFDILPGEIHGLVGENGAGKSTLMRILSGFYQPDAGTIYVEGKPTHISSPAHSRQLGISMVYQDTRLVGDLDVAQNISLGREPSRLGLVDLRAMEQEAQSLLARLGFEISPFSLIKELGLAERQSIEIARALSIKSKVLILDEPTTGLDSQEVEKLFGILRDLRGRGTGIVLISHRLPEVLAIADRVTVMKDGVVVATRLVADITEDDLIRLMVGRDISMAYPPKATKIGPSRLEVQNLTKPGHFVNVSFTLNRGEIVGLGGIQGNGQTEIMRALAGLLSAQGTVWLDGQRVTLSSPGAMIEQGVVFLSSDRRGESLFLPHSVRENMSFPHLGRFSHRGIISAKAEKQTVKAIIERLRIQTPSDERPIELLSGGNQQKVVVGRWLISEPRVYLFDEPTQGVDVGTKIELYHVIRDLAEAGASVLLHSTEVIELLGLCDRVLVVADGRIVDEVEAKEATEERIVGSAVTAARDDKVLDAQVKKTVRVSRFSRMVERWGSPFLILLLVVLIGFFTQRESPYFLKAMNLSALIIQIVPLALVAMGEMIVILLAGIDLSVGPTMSLITVIASYLISSSASGPETALGVVACLASGVLVGLTNGALVRYLKMPDLIATLATYSVVFGVCLVLRPAPGGSIHAGFMTAMTHRLGPVPTTAIVVAVLYVMGELLLVRGRIGMALYATGSSREAALVAGIPVARVRFIAYVFSGLMAALAGLVLSTRIGSGDPQSGTNFTLMAVTAVVVGGTSIFGGRGTLLGALMGSILIIETQNALNQLHVSAYYQYIWIGILTLLAVVIYTIREGNVGIQNLRRLFSRR